jgi:enterochelin esterase family protein
VVIGGPAGTNFQNARMTRLENTDVWFRTYKVRNDARFIYSLSPNDSLIPIEKIDPKDREAMNRRLAGLHPDPLNPKHDPGGMPSSYAELREAPKQTWLQPLPGIRKGAVEKTPFKSALLDNTRDLWIYTPPDFSRENGRYPLLVMFDGQSYVEAAPTPVILDNLIAKKKIPPLIAIFIGNPTSASRASELTCSPMFADFVAFEVVPWMREKYGATSDPHSIGAAGASFGGLAAAYVSFRHPEVFGNALSQSGSLWWKPGDAADPEWLTKQYAMAPNTGARLFVEAGLMEDGESLTGPSLLSERRNVGVEMSNEAHRQRRDHTRFYFDGKTGWGSFADMVKFRDTPVVPLAGADLDMVRKEVRGFWLNLWRAQDQDVGVSGPRTLRFVDRADRTVRELELDPDTSLPRSDITEWMVVNGVKVPKHSLNYHGGELVADIETVTVKVNTGLKASDLARPPDAR